MEVPPRPRLRLLFEDDGILADHQKSDGLDRSWILLHPNLTTVSDLISHLTRSFSLHSSCPGGLVLSMDEFVLPPFESTAIFKDCDLVRVWKKDAPKRDVMSSGENAMLIEDADAVEKQTIFLFDKPLVIEDMGKKIIENLSEKKEDVNEEPEEPKSNEADSSHKMMSRKRKHLDLKKQIKVCRKIRCREIADPFYAVRRKKKMKSTKSESCAIPFVEGSEADNVERKEHPVNINNVEKKIPESNGQLPEAERRPKMLIASETLKRDSHSLQEKSEDNQRDPQATDGVKKFPSRSARRKKAKRKWLQKQANSEKEKTFLTERTSPPIIDLTYQDTTVEAVKEKKFVPVVVRPGHIRFEQSDEDEQTEQQLHVQGTIEWNGTLDKKKGQKWGRERTSTSQKTGKVDIGGGCRRKDDLEEGEVVDPVDFEKLCPLTSLPKVGDVVAYRLVELTSSWCPEISTFRVGKVSSFDPETKNSILVPVPGHPIPTEKGDEESEIQQDNSLYEDDGSLEIDFTSLIDVRLLKDSNSETHPSTSKNDTNLACSFVTAANSRANLHIDNVTPSSTVDSGKEIAGWDEISEALNKKKAELLQKDSGSCEKAASTPGNPETKPSWSFRALRKSALGPTISLLRATNQL